MKIELVRGSWSLRLGSLLRQIDRELVIASPFVSRFGIEHVIRGLSRRCKEQGRITFITSFDVLSVCQGSTDPSAIAILLEESPAARLVHLPRLHAKVYIFDSSTAVITSGNLTRSCPYLLEWVAGRVSHSWSDQA